MFDSLRETAGVKNIASASVLLLYNTYADTEGSELNLKFQRYVHIIMQRKVRVGVREQKKKKRYEKSTINIIVRLAFTKRNYKYCERMFYECFFNNEINQIIRPS